MVRVVVSACVVIASFLAGCSGHDASVGDNRGASNQQLQKKKDGSPTGDGATCSWAETTTYDTCASSTAPVPTYKLGDEFKSIDGCNECECTDKGIMCTVRECGGGGPSQVPPSPPSGPIACDLAQRICKEGYPAKPLPNRCEQWCPEDGPYPGEGSGTACPAVLRVCKDNIPPKQIPDTCEQICPEDAQPTDPVACTTDAKKCPDGTYVGRVGPKCEFKPCP